MSELSQQELSVAEEAIPKTCNRFAQSLKGIQNRVRRRTSDVHSF